MRTRGIAAASCRPQHVVPEVVDDLVEGGLSGGWRSGQVRRRDRADTLAQAAVPVHENAHAASKHGPDRPRLLGEESLPDVCLQDGEVDVEAVTEEDASLALAEERRLDEGRGWVSDLAEPVGRVQERPRVVCEEDQVDVRPPIRTAVRARLRPDEEHTAKVRSMRRPSREAFEERVRRLSRHRS